MIFYWWILRCGGAQNIPKELLMKKTEDGLRRTMESLYNALRVMPDDATKEEKEMLLKAIHEINEVQHMYEEGMKNDLCPPLVETPPPSGGPFRCIM
ncbi:hypothetical protein COW81_02780 [Candidatus Campbellbacteria bacterium CG22_combo_CG10-13_8_21_14_all_36_13]|uniref:Uncharacterized protein n=1 Tax=Candidatus Campbellbacteria bacterium CG22_combo_CG10-13_8_21_14_all_36_13 TaxID=1974529 RepID=A0A2H0DXR2_9BACT|nr:MAG: hypothetical protein COW81_02780 [Candidatus Campbellbacteria bacterium CG22_combo_CG10-13_8_21_14_all_36_13]